MTNESIDGTEVMENMPYVFAWSHLFGPCRFGLLHLVGLHLGLHLLPVLPYGALFGSQPGAVFTDLPDGRELAHNLLGPRLHGLTYRQKIHKNQNAYQDFFDFIFFTADQTKSKKKKRVHCTGGNNLERNLVSLTDILAAKSI